MPPLTKKVRKKFQLFEKKTVFFLLFLRPLLNSREVNTGNEVDSLKNRYAYLGNQGRLSGPADQ